MADRTAFSSLLHRQSNSVSPFTDTTHSHTPAKSRRPFSSNFKVIAPLLILGIAAVVATSGMFNGSGTTTKAAQTQLSATQDSKSASTQTTNQPAVSPAGGSNTMNTSTTGSASNDTSSNMQVTVNGQDVPVPANGTVQQTVTTPDGGTSSYSVTTNTNGNATNYNSSFQNLNVSTNSSTASGAHGYHMMNGVAYYY